MRFYSFINRNLSPSEALQSTGNMIYYINQLNDAAVSDWSQWHKTMIILDGGYTPNLVQLHTNLCTYSNGKYIVTKDIAENLEIGHRSWNAVGLLVPITIYEPIGKQMTEFENNLHLILNNFKSL